MNLMFEPCQVQKDFATLFYVLCQVQKDFAT